MPAYYIAGKSRDTGAAPVYMLKYGMPDDKSRLVYSTEKTVARKEKPAGNMPQAGVAFSAQKVTVRLDRKCRGGKTCTVIDGILMPRNKMEELLRQLKTKLGTGGTIKDESLEIQGDHANTVMATLKDMGFAPKRSGGQGQR